LTAAAFYGAAAVFGATADGFAVFTDGIATGRRTVRSSQVRPHPLIVCRLPPNITIIPGLLPADVESFTSDQHPNLLITGSRPAAEINALVGSGKGTLQLRGGGLRGSAHQNDQQAGQQKGAADKMPPEQGLETHFSHSSRAAPNQYGTMPSPHRETIAENIGLFSSSALEVVCSHIYIIDDQRPGFEIGGQT
jgi:hypothetical protein